MFADELDFSILKSRIKRTKVLTTILNDAENVNKENEEGFAELLGEINEFIKKHEHEQKLKKTIKAKKNEKKKKKVKL